MTTTMLDPQNDTRVTFDDETANNKPVPTDAIRPLASLEHLFWLIDQNRPVTAQVSGETSVRDWRKALARLQERHSLLSVSIEGKPGAIPWFRQVKTAPIPLRVVHGDPQSRWEAEVAEELATPLDSRHAPLVRAVLIHAADNAAFTLVAHHAIADGMSLDMFSSLYRLFQAVSG